MSAPNLFDAVPAPAPEPEIKHEGESKIAHCKACERDVLAITRRNARGRFK